MNLELNGMAELNENEIKLVNGGIGLIGGAVIASGLIYLATEIYNFSKGVKDGYNGKE